MLDKTMVLHNFETNQNFSSKVLKMLVCIHNKNSRKLFLNLNPINGVNFKENLHQRISRQNGLKIEHLYWKKQNCFRFPLFAFTLLTIVD